MHDFITINLNTPVVLFAALLVVSLLYWGAVIVGALDLDLDLDFDLDADADLGAASAGGVLSALGLAGVPAPMLVTGIAFVGWIVSFLCALWIQQEEIAFGWAARLGVGVGSFAVGALATGLVARVVRPLIGAKPAAKAGAALVGRTARVTSGEIGPGGGRAAIVVDGVDVAISARTDPERAIAPRGTEVLIVEYDEARHVYTVERMPT